LTPAVPDEQVVPVSGWGCVAVTYKRRVTARSNGFND
jgi:hypothetical protein